MTVAREVETGWGSPCLMGSFAHGCVGRTKRKVDSSASFSTFGSQAYYHGHKSLTNNNLGSGHNHDHALKLLGFEGELQKKGRSYSNKATHAWGGVSFAEQCS